jgi:hypothetical protein
VPNLELLECYLQQTIADSDVVEATISDSATFLTVCSAAKDDAAYSRSSARVTSALKAFKLSCTKSHKQFADLVVIQGTVTVLFDRFTPNTMIYAGDPAREPGNWTAVPAGHPQRTGPLLGLEWGRRIGSPMGPVTWAQTHVPNVERSPVAQNTVADSKTQGDVAQQRFLDFIGLQVVGSAPIATLYWLILE